MNAKGKTYDHGPSLRAYSLVEVLVAVSLVGIMVVSLYAGFSSGFTVVRLSREESRATQIVLQKLEEFHYCTWSQLTSLPSSTSFQASFDPLATNSDPSETVYWGTVSIAAPDAIPDTADYKANMRQVTVSVRWTNYNGSMAVARTNEMTTLVARYGAQNYAFGGKP